MVGSRREPVHPRTVFFSLELCRRRAPDHVYNNDYTYTYTFQTGNEIAAFGHTNVQDTTIYSEYPNTNFAGEAP